MYHVFFRWHQSSHPTIINISILEKRHDLNSSITLFDNKLSQLFELTQLDTGDSTLELLTKELDLVLIDTIMLSLPALAMVRKGLRFWLRSSREHTHLHDYLSGEVVCLRIDWATRRSERHKSRRISSHDSLSTITAKESIDRSTASGLKVGVLLQRAIAVFDLDLLFFNE